MYDPGGDLPAERQFPFVTIVTGDHYDSVSNLNRPGTYRLNIGLTKATYVASFGAAPTQRGADGVLDTGFDHAAVDTLMPHPIYAAQHWVCVVNPGEAKLETVRTLLAGLRAPEKRSNPVEVVLLTLTFGEAPALSVPVDVAGTRRMAMCGC